MGEKWVIKNDGAKSHEVVVKAIEWLKLAGEQPNTPKELKPLIDETVARGVPAEGEPLELTVPQVLSNQVMQMLKLVRMEVERLSEGASKEEMDKYITEQLPVIVARTIGHLTEKYVSARNEIEADNERMKEFYRSQTEMPGKTKADLLKILFEELAKHTDKPAPPLDEEFLAELEKVPAVEEGEKPHIWGTA